MASDSTHAPARPADRSFAVAVLAAGRGTRMRSALPKVLHPIAGLSMLEHVLAAASALNPARIAVVAAPDTPDVAAAAAPHPVAIQRERRGTADAARAALPALADCGAGTLLILCGDTPLIAPGTLRRLADARRDGAAVAVLGFRASDPAGYGRLAMDADGRLEAIVEHRDATPAQRAIDVCNAGVMALDMARAVPLLARIGDGNAAGERYLTDAVALARAAGLPCAAVMAPEAEVMGVNDRAALAAAETIWQARRRDRAMRAEGATLIAPETVFFAHDTVLGQDVTVGPHVVFGPGVTVADGARIHAFCHLEGARVAAGASVGPFARLRPGAAVGRGARVGNFVEMKRATLGDGARAGHLAYLGDAAVGANANIGAGVITCNYDGAAKHRTEIGDGAFIGSNAALVAPVTVGAGAVVGAGSAITDDVPPGSLAIGRARQAIVRRGTEQKDGGAD